MSFMGKLKSKAESFIDEVTAELSSITGKVKKFPIMLCIVKMKL